MADKINARVTYYRKTFGYTKRQMSEMLGIKYTTYVRTEQYGNISGKLLIKLAEIFKMDVRLLLYDEIPEEPKTEPQKPEEPSSETTDLKNTQPTIILGYKYINAQITVLENNILKQLERLSLNQKTRSI